MKTKGDRSMTGPMGLFLALCLVAGMPSTAPPAQARPQSLAHVNAIGITTTADEYDVEGAGLGCSLREAIQAANTDAAFGGCAAGSGDDTINLPAGAYTLTRPGADEDDNATGDLDLKSNITIAGAGAGSSVMDGNQLDRVLHIHGAVVVELTDLAIINGRTPDGADGPPGGGAYPGQRGGGIYSEGGVLTIRRCAISGNRGGDGGRGGDLGNDGWSGDGGGGSWGGGIYSLDGALTIEDSRLANNAAGDGGDGGNGGLGGYGGEGGGGGAICTDNSPLIIRDSVFSDNRGGTGGKGGAGTTGPYGGNGGRGGLGGPGAGVYFHNDALPDGLLLIEDSVFERNIAGNGDAGGPGGPGAQAGRFGVGGDGGGIRVLTALAANTTVTITGTTLESNHSGNTGSGGGIHTLGFYATGVIEITLRDSTVISNTTGAGVDEGWGGNGGGIFHHTGTLTVTNSVVRGNRTGGGQVGGGGGGIRSYGKLVIRNSEISENRSGDGLADPPGTGGRGGAIWHQDGELIIEDSAIRHNAAGGGAAGGAAGGVANYDSSLTIRNSRFEGNQAGDGGVYSGGPGGAVYHTNGALAVENSIFTDNRAGNGTMDGGSGGAIFSNDGVVMVAGCTFSGNGTGSSGDFSGGNGGAIRNLRGQLSIENSAFTSNSTGDGKNGGHGGAIYNTQGDLTIQQSAVQGNYTGDTGPGGYFGSYGGAIYHSEGALAVQDSAFTDNSTGAGGQGGGLYVMVGAHSLTNVTISGNSTARSGGGIYHTANADGALQLANSTITDNIADADNDGSGRGGGCYAGSSGRIEFQNTIIAGNQNQSDSSAADCHGPVVSQGYNVVTAGAGCPSAGAGDLVVADPRLAPLADNGGPTFTHALLFDSPAIDAGDPTGCKDPAGAAITADQRGQARDDLRCDTGAFELKYEDSATVAKAITGEGTFTYGPTLVQIDVTTRGDLAGLTVTRTRSDHPQATQMNGQWWAISAETQGAAPYAVNLSLPHTVVPHTDAWVCRYEAAGGQGRWDCTRHASTETRVTRNGVSDLAYDWAVGAGLPAPTATPTSTRTPIYTPTPTATPTATATPTVMAVYLPLVLR